jgi:hypothetical protein
MAFKFAFVSDISATFNPSTYTYTIVLLSNIKTYSRMLPSTTDAFPHGATLLVITF